MVFSKTITSSSPRPPVVVLLGHIDHGKTSILDYICKTNVAQKEAGEITQHIGACEIGFQDKKITFIDTPGHEAFSKMRSHGVRLADLALLVIAANEGVKPQTKEALKQIRELNLPYIVVLNKIDLLPKYSSLGKVERQLKEEKIEIESWGGDIPLVKTSTKTGEGIDELLETILILGELALSGFPKKQEDSEWGVVIETQISAKRGIEAVLLIKNGTFKTGDLIKSESQLVKIRKIINWQRNELKEAYPSQPVSILGFSELPEVGEIFKKVTYSQGKVFEKSLARDNLGREFLAINNAREDAKEINFIVKTDVLGSRAPVLKTLEVISRDLNVNFLVLRQGLGEMSEFDLKLAQSAKAFILGFKIKAPTRLKAIAERLGIKVIICDIIYDIKDRLKEIIVKQDSKAEEKEIKGQLEVLAVFRKRELSDKKKRKNVFKMIIGGRVIKGELVKNCLIEVRRNKKVTGQGKILEIEKERKPIAKVIEGEECGLLYEGGIEIKKGDFLTCFHN